MKPFKITLIILTILLTIIITITLTPKPTTQQNPLNQTQNILKEPYIITKVIDGDTVHINGESVRLICIDHIEV